MDTIVVFGGWGASGAGERIDRTETTGTTQLVDRLEQMPQVPLRRRRVRAWQGALMDGSGVNAALDWIRDGFDPRGNLIIYGYSAGGGDALMLSWQIAQGMGYYELATGRFFSMAGADRVYRGELGVVRIDLLLTVDRAAGPASGNLFNKVPRAVRVNHNYYQTIPSGVRSHGQSNDALDSTSTRVVNHDWTARYNGSDSAHGQIDNDTLDVSVGHIQGVIGVEALPSLVVPGGGVPT